MHIAGHHHVSMITKDAKENIHFYRDQLGLRFVKKTVNQDDPSMYHLFYGDAVGNPGTVLTFFEMSYVGTTYHGTNAITRIGLFVENKEALVYWKARFKELKIPHENITTYDSRPALPFEDPDGLKLLLIAREENEMPSMWKRWEESLVPAKYQILGMGPIEMTVRRPEKLGKMLQNVFGYLEVSSSENKKVYQSIQGKTHSEIVIKNQDGKTEKPGRGSVHHLAIRVKNEQEIRKWESIIEKRGYESSGVIDRYYFHSLYFRDTNGIVFELATDGPGLHIDEPMEAL